MKNQIEQVTNLERETVKYVPKSCFDSLYYKIKYLDESEYDTLNLFSEDERNRIEVIKGIADANEIEKPIIPDDPVEVAKEMELNICPYCGSKMILKIIDYDVPVNTSIRNRSLENLAYVCKNCGSRSPWVHITTNVIDENKFSASVKRLIDDIKEDMAAEDDDEMF